MTNKQKLQLYEQRFQNTLVGIWVTIEGTFFLMSETFVFEDNGKGLWTRSSGSGECKTYFGWRITEPFFVEIRTTVSIR